MSRDIMLGLVEFERNAILNSEPHLRVVLLGLVEFERNAILHLLEPIDMQSDAIWIPSEKKKLFRFFLNFLNAFSV